MSMYSIEDLVELSVITVSEAPSIDKSLARSICFSLYRLQDQFDCSYTIFRVPNELKKLGYLYAIPVNKLPEEEREEALELIEDFDGEGGDSDEEVGEGDFLSDDESYIDCENEICYVTAGSDLWEKLMEEGIIPKSEKSGFKHIDLLDLAEQIISLASAKLAKGNKEEADILGMWYMFLPTFCSEIEPEDGEYDQEKIDMLLKTLAIPEVFEAAEGYEDDPSLSVYPDDAEDTDNFSEWFTPYLEWKGN